MSNSTDEDAELCLIADPDEQVDQQRHQRGLRSRRGLIALCGGVLFVTIYAGYSIKDVPVLNSEATSTLAQEYSDEGFGKCVTPDGKKPKHKWFGSGNVKAKCDNDAACTGYSASVYGGGLLFYGPLKGGGDSWGSCHCNIKRNAAPVVKQSSEPVVTTTGVPAMELADQVKPPGRPFPNVNLIASGYNIFYADPMPVRHSGGTNMDPGLRKPVFRVNYKKQSLTGDRRHARPDGYFATVDFGCSEVFSTKTVSDNYELSSEINLEASTSGSLGLDVDMPPTADKFSFSHGDHALQDPGVGAFVGVAGTLSASAKKIKKDNLFNDHRIVTSSARCAVYSAGISYGSPPETDPNFKAAVDSAAGKKDWYNIFDQYGTHFLSSVKMGARFGAQLIFTKSHYDAAYSTIAKAGVSFGPVVEAGIKLAVVTPDTPALDVAWDPKASVDIERKVGEQVKNIQSHASSEVMQGVGPSMPPGGASKWMEAVEKNPTPMRFQKMQICVHPGLTKEQGTSCASAMKTYCSEHLKIADCNSKEKRECQIDSDCSHDHACRGFKCVEIPVCHVEIFDNSHYGGGAHRLDPVTAANYPNGKPINLLNMKWYDRISSIRLSDGCASVKLFDDDPGNFFEGYAQDQTFHSSQASLPDDLNDDVWQILIKAKPIPGKPPFQPGAGSAPSNLPKPRRIEFNPSKDSMFAVPGRASAGLNKDPSSSFLPNIGKAMYGYHHYYGAPFSTKYAGVDPGFRTRGVWNVSYTAGLKAQQAVWNRMPMAPKARYFVVFAAKHPNVKQAQADAKDPLGAAHRYFEAKLAAANKTEDDIAKGKMSFSDYRGWERSVYEDKEHAEPELAVDMPDDKYCSLQFELTQKLKAVKALGEKHFKKELDHRRSYGSYGYYRRLREVGSKYCKEGKLVTWTQTDQDKKNKIEAEERKKRQSSRPSYGRYSFYGGRPFGRPFRRLQGPNTTPRRLDSRWRDASKWFTINDKPNMREFGSLAKAKQALRSESKCLGQKKKTCPSGADYDLNMDGTTWEIKQSRHPYYSRFSSYKPANMWEALQDKLKSEWPRFVVKVVDDKVNVSGVIEIDGQLQTKGWKEGFDSKLPSMAGLNKLLQHVKTHVDATPKDGTLMGELEAIEVSVPDGWEAFQSKGEAYCEADMQTAIIKDAHSYEKRTSSAFGIPETSATIMGSGFSFGLSYEKKELLRTKGSQSRKMAAASAECGMYYARIKDLKKSPPPVEPAFRSLVEKAKRVKDYHIIFDQYGLHFPSEIVFGARYGTTQYITSSSFMAYQQSQESLSLDFGVQVSVPTKVPGVDVQATRDVNIGYDGTKTSKESVSKYFNERRTFSVGKRLPAGGVDEWKKDMRSEPMPIRFSLIPICQHPIFKDKAMCESAWNSYCEDHLRTQNPELACGESEEGNCVWDIDCDNENDRCEQNRCVRKPACVVTLFSEDSWKGQQKRLQPFYWREDRPLHIIELNKIHWSNKARSMTISGGCSKVIKMASNALDAKDNYVITNYDGNSEKKQNGVRNAKWLALYPKEWFSGEKPDW